MARLVIIALAFFIVSCASFPTALQKLDQEAVEQVEPFNVAIVSRAAWGARAPTSVSRIGRAVDIVVIHHTFQPPVCMNRNDCIRAMRSIQDHHQLTNRWADIGYNFAVGGDGSVYEGRGWDVVGAHAQGFNSQSIGIVLIGDFRNALPPLVARQAAQRLITTGVNLGFIRGNYRLTGHRQLGSTECPGNALFREIQTWANFRKVIS